MDDQPKSAGPGAIKDSPTGVVPRLDGASENEYIEILNPLSVVFSARVASSRPVNAPVRVVVNENTPTATRNEDDIRRNYGLDLRNPDHASLAHIAQSIEIGPGKTVRLPGNEAQVVVKQLVNEILQREGRKLFIGDPSARQEVEDRIILKRGSMSEFFGQQAINVREELNKGLDDDTEQSFPTEDVAGEDQEQPDTVGQSDSRTKRGRPPKSAVKS